MTRNAAYLLSIVLVICLGIGASAAFADDDGDTFGDSSENVERGFGGGTGDERGGGFGGGTGDERGGGFGGGTGDERGGGFGDTFGTISVSSGEDKQKTYYELQQLIEQKQSAFADAIAESEEATAAIEANEERIAELEREIPKQRERSSVAARDLYKFQQESLGIVDALLSSDNIGDFITNIDYMNRVSQANLDEIHRLNDLKAEVDKAQLDLKAARTEAEMRAEDARVAMMTAQEAQAEVQRRIEEEARLQAQIAAEAARMAEIERVNDSGEPATPETGTVEEPAVNTVGTSVQGEGDAEGDAGAEPGAGAGGASAGAGEPDAGADAGEPGGAGEPDAGAGEPDAGAGAGDPADTTERPDDASSGGGEVAAPDQGSYEGEDAYVAEWAARIDAYLAGSPLAGQGLTFARAAYEYGVDPRLSPAISFTESGKGAACFLSHNAWGWGSASWDSWEEAINDHVAGLARGYGGQLSIEGAQKYCPPNWRAWYDRTLSQMEMI